MDLTTQILQQLKDDRGAIDETIDALELLSRRQAEAQAAISAKAGSSSSVNLRSARNGRSQKK